MTTQLYCNWRSRIYQPKTSLIVSQKKEIHVHRPSILRVTLGVVVLVSLAFSLVISVTSLSVITVHLFWGTMLIGQDWIRNVTAIFALITVQYSVFRYFTAKYTSALSHSRNSHTQTCSIVNRSLAHCTTPSRIQQPTAFMRLLLLLAGDVELNPGPNGKENVLNPESTDTGYNSTAASIQTPSTAAEENILVATSSSSVLPGETNGASHNKDVDSSTNVDTSASITQPIVYPTLPDSASSPSLPINGNLPMPFISEQVDMTQAMIPDPIKLEESNQADSILPAATPIVSTSGHLFATPQTTNTSVVTHMKLLEEKDRIIEQKDTEISRLKEELTRLKQKQSFASGLKAIFEPQSQELANQTFIQLLPKIYEVVENHVDPESGKCLERLQPEYCTKLKGLLDQLIDLLSKHLWNRKTGFTKVGTLEQSVFLVLANQLLRFRQEFDYCPHCCCHKDDRRLDNTSEHPGSHIWPSVLFKEYCHLHRYEAKKCIVDVTDPLRPKLVGPKEVKLKMLCAECERDASDWENSLWQLYNCIMSKPDMQIEVPNTNQWLNSIFATVLLRGIFVNCNFIKYIRVHGKYFLDSVYDLQRYVTEKDYMLKKKIYLFLLPNCFYIKKLQEFLYLLEISLRNPQFTTLISSDKEGSFLYTQFDCFHCVYPVCQKSVEHFRLEYSSALPPLTQDVYMVSPDSERRPIFPEILIKVNMRRANKLFDFLCNAKDSIPATLDECFIFIKLGQANHQREEARISKYTSINTRNAAVYNFRILDGKLLHQSLAKGRESARCLSVLNQLPFGRIDPHKAIGYINLKHRMAKLKDRLEELRTKRDRFHVNMQVLKEEIKDLREECEGDDDRKARYKEVNNQFEDLEQAVEKTFYEPFEGLNTSMFHSEEELNS